MAKDRFQYLPYLIPLMVVELILFIFLMLRWNKKSVMANRDDRGENGIDSSLLVNSVIYTGVIQSDSDNAMPSSQRLAAKQEFLRDELNIIRPVRFIDTYESWGPITRKLLFVTRLLSFLYFSIVSIYGEDEHNGNFAFQYFTTWNLYLLSFYYLMAFIASSCGLCIDSNGVHPHTFLGIAVNMLYEVAGSSAFLVTVVAFCFLDSKLTFGNMTVHLFTTGSILIEIGLNHMEVLPLHAILNTLWASAYLGFIWTTVATGVVEEWPYPFLETDSWQCFLWYTGLFVGCIVFYTVFYFISISKMKWHNKVLKQQMSEMDSAGAMFSDPIGTRNTDSGHAFA
jgi:hypothetical protein